jgi:hypothetical protein
MDAMQSRWARVGRGAVGAAVATLVAALSHTIAGGVPPTWFGVAVTFVLAASAGSVLAGKSVSWVRLTVSVGLGQAMFHLLFAGMGTPTPVVHDHGTALAALAPHDHAMVWAHVIAGMLTIAALRYGEVAFWALTDALRFVVRRIELPALPVPAQAPFEGETPALRPLGIPRLLAGRGPPIEFAQPI